MVCPLDTEQIPSPVSGGGGPPYGPVGSFFQIPSHAKVRLGKVPRISVLIGPSQEVPMFGKIRLTAPAISQESLGLLHKTCPERPGVRNVSAVTSKKGQRAAMARKTKSKPDQKVRFFYIKSSQFRVIHVDGVIGAPTPNGFLHFGVYSERAAFPQSSEHTLSPEGRLSPPTSEEGKRGIVRELDTDLIMNIETATELRDFLTEQIDRMNRREQARRRKS